MALISDIQNLVNCSFAQLFGAGEEGCNFDFGNLKHLRFYTKGFTMASTVDLTKSYHRTQQQAGNLVMCLNDQYDFTWNITEPQREQANASGLSSTTRPEIYQLQIMRRKGAIDQKVLNGLDQQNFDVVLVDVDGNELLVGTSTGGQKGFTTSMIEQGAIQFANGTTSQKTGLTIEFSNASQFKSKLTWNLAENLPYFAEEITDPNQLKVSIPSAPVDSATTIVSKVVLERGGGFVSGLTVSDFMVKVNGATVTPSGITANADNKTYTFTVSALSTSDTIEVKLYDSSASSSVVVKNPGEDDVLYKSNSATSVVVAA